MTKIKIRRKYQHVSSNEADVIKEAYSLIKKGDLKSAKTNMETIAISQILEDFADDISEPTDATLKIFKKILVICKELCSNEMTLLSDIIYDPMLTKYKLYRPEPIVENLKLSRRSVDIDHQYPELKGTLDKANIIYNKDKLVALDKSLEKFFEKIFEANLGEKIKFIVTLKFDGVAIVATVVNGKIVLALSRGEDDKGADLTHLFRHIEFDIPANTSGVKFECIMTKNNFKRYCEDKGKKYANLRSSVVSVVTRTKDTKFAKYLSLAPIQCTDLKIGDYDGLNDRYAGGVKNLPWVFNATSVLEATNKISDLIYLIKEYRHEYDFAIDGVVIDCVNTRVRNTLGRKNNINQYQIAYKFEAAEVFTKALSVTTSTGRTGLVVPMIHYEKIYFDGTGHDKSTLSSYKRFVNMQIRYHDTLRVTYNNEVMPYVHKPDGKENSTNTNDLIPFPDKCQSCKSVLVLNGANYYCMNTECPSKMVSSYEHFYKKLGIRNISDSTVTSMIDIGAINTFDSLLNIDYKVLITCEGFGEVKIEDYSTQISKLCKTEIDEAKLVSALGISGESDARKILACIDIKSLFTDYDKLYSLEIPSIGDKKKSSFITNLENMKVYVLHYIGILNVCPVKVSNSKMQVCFTGFRDADLKEMLALLDIEVIDFKKSISYLVVKDINDTKSKGKIDKAISANIPVISKEDFATLIREEY